MFNYKCPNGERRQQGNKVWIQCNLMNRLCGFQRYCIDKRDVEHTTMAPSCILYKRELEKENKLKSEENL